MQLVYLSVAIVLLNGCSYRGAYEGIQASNRNECASLPQAGYEECMATIDQTYDDYQRERDDVIDE